MTNSLLDTTKKIQGPTTAVVGVYDTTPPTIADGDTRPLQIDARPNASAPSLYSPPAPGTLRHQ